MTHRFQLNQFVRMTNPRVGTGAAGTSGVFQVSRLMPADVTGEVSYRIKSTGSGERAVRESEIAPGGSGS